MKVKESAVGLLFFLLSSSCVTLVRKDPLTPESTFSAARMVRFYNPADQGIFCSGVFVTPNKFVTAAHCALGPDGKPFARAEILGLAKSSKITLHPEASAKRTDLEQALRGNDASAALQSLQTFAAVDVAVVEFPSSVAVTPVSVRFAEPVAAAEQNFFSVSYGNFERLENGRHHPFGRMGRRKVTWLRPGHLESTFGEFTPARPDVDLLAPGDSGGPIFRCLGLPENCKEISLVGLSSGASHFAGEANPAGPVTVIASMFSGSSVKEFLMSIVLDSDPS